MKTTIREFNGWPNEARGRSGTQSWIPWLPGQSHFCSKNSCLHHSCCLEKPIPVLDTAYIINIMVNFILSLKHLLYTLFYQTVLQLWKGGKKEAREVECSLFSFAETPVKDWCQEPRTSPLFRAISGTVGETEYHHALMIIKQITWHGEYSNDLPGCASSNYEQVVFQMFASKEVV